MFDPQDDKSEEQALPEDSGPPQEPHEQGVSLEGLSEAFAEALGKPDQSAHGAAVDGTAVDGVGGDEAQQPQEPASDTSDSQAEPDGEQPQQALDRNEEAADGLPDSYQDDSRTAVAQEEDPCPISPHTIFEAMLFVGNTDNRPLESRRVAELMRGVEPEEIPDIVDQLNERYAENGCPYTIVAEGAGYRMKLIERFYPLRNKFYGRVREARLSQAAVNVLAIVAYCQPITREEINRLRNKHSSHVISQLVRRRLLQIERPADRSAKAVYRTTDRFLELFGLENIDELPKSEGVVE